jgi:diguanylate cyclase (GGDEF)-like protein
MNPRINPIRIRLLVATTFVLALLSFGAMSYELRSLDRGNELSARARNLSTVRVVKRLLDGGRAGEWSARGGYLYRKKEKVVDGPSLRSELAGFLPADAAIVFGIGEPPAALPAGGGQASPETIRPDLPFLSDLGACVAIRDEAGAPVGWIAVSSAADQRMLFDNRLAIMVVLALAALYLIMVGMLGALSLRAAGPRDDAADADSAAKDRLEDKSRRDHLTGLLNRRGLGEALEDPLSNHGLSHVAILDIDRFSATKEERGREEGDRILAALARTLVAIVRGADLCGRWEGDAFVVVYRGLAREYAAVSGERIRAGVEARAFGAAGAALGITVTVGIAPMGARGFAEAAAAAERAMLEGKAVGGNRVVVAA